MIDQHADPRTEDTLVFELLRGRAFVDRVRPDERPRGYRRTGRGIVDLLVPGMPEHFIARMRGLWLSYPDGSVITARAAAAGSSTAVAPPEAPHVRPPGARAPARRAPPR